MMGWRNIIRCGLLWGIGVTIADSLTQPVGDLTFGQWLFWVSDLLLERCVAGLIWATGATLARGRWTVPVLMILPVVTTLAAIAPALWSGVSSPGVTGSGALWTKIPLWDLLAYLLWINLFFGGLYVAGYLATSRTARQRHRLARYQLAHSEADMLLRETRIVAFRGQLQPQLLLRALAALRERYARDMEAGNALFDHLIAFLRAAMPSVRSGFSTLSAECETVRCYSALRDSLAERGAQWRLDLPHPAPALPFPSLILMPALDGVSALLGPDETLSLTLSRDQATNVVLLTLDSSRAVALPDAIDHRLRGGLALTFGRSAHVSDGPELPIRIRLTPALDREETLDGTFDGGGNDATETVGDGGKRPARSFLR